MIFRPSCLVSISWGEESCTKMKKLVKFKSCKYSTGWFCFMASQCLTEVGRKCFTSSATEGSCTLPLTPETWELSEGLMGAPGTAGEWKPRYKSHSACQARSDCWKDRGAARLTLGLGVPKKGSGSVRFHCNDCFFKKN